MDYQQLYNKLIAQAKNRQSIEKPYDSHHIIPKCFFKSHNIKNGWLDGYHDDADNIVKLTIREHFIAHLLLAKIHGGVMNVALMRMITCKRYTSKQYEIARKKAGEYTKSIFTEEKIETMNELLRQQITCPYCNKSGAMTIMKRWHFDKCKLSPVYIPPPKMKRGKPSKDTISKMVQSQSKTYSDPTYVHPNKGRVMDKHIQCEKCGMHVGQGQYTRWHGNNCKNSLQL